MIAHTIRSIVQEPDKKKKIIIIHDAKIYTRDFILEIVHGYSINLSAICWEERGGCASVAILENTLS